MTTNTSSDAVSGTDVLVLLGTTKGLFTLRSGDGRQHFELAGPTFAGEEVYSTCIDTRVAVRPGCSPARSATTGARCCGAPTTSARAGPRTNRRRSRSPRAADASLARIWQLAPGPADEPDVIYAGVEPAALFRSDDGGRTLLAGARACGTTRTARSGSRAVAGSASTPCSSTPTTRAAADRHLGGRASTGPTTAARRGGRATAGIVAGFMPEGEELEFGQCVHKVARDAGEPERLYLQHHGGIYRSDDGGGIVDADDGHRRHGLRLPGRRPPDRDRRPPTCCRSRATSTAARPTATAPCGGRPTPASRGSR